MISRASIAIVVVMSVPALLGCGGGDDGGGGGGGGDQAEYPAQVEKNFLSSCEANGGSASACRCALDEVQKEFTFDEYKKEEERIAGGAKPSQGITDAVEKCRE